VIIWLNEQASPAVIGTKGSNLSLLTRAGFPVPPGFCISVDGFSLLSISEIDQAVGRLQTRAVAVRSSAVEEDLSRASFAGIYPTRLNVCTPEGVIEALNEIQAAREAPATLAYCRKRGISGDIRMAAIVQQLIVPDASGVLFMNDPIGGRGRIVIEGSWSLGESVVSGAVIPDQWVLSRNGEILTAKISNKDIAVVPAIDGTRLVEVDLARRRLPCLDEPLIQSLFELAFRCQEFFGGPQDIEWAADRDKVWLLQSRPITSAMLR
jgi:pyruvate,water dikinase